MNKFNLKITLTPATTSPNILHFVNRELEFLGQSSKSMTAATSKRVNETYLQGSITPPNIFQFVNREQEYLSHSSKSMIAAMSKPVNETYVQGSITFPNFFFFFFVNRKTKVSRTK